MNLVKCQGRALLGSTLRTAQSSKFAGVTPPRADTSCVRNLGITCSDVIAGMDFTHTVTTYPT